jgi:hypothetical protein
MTRPKQKDFQSEGAFLQQVVERRPEPCTVSLGNWNTAVSLKARLDRLIRYSELMYRDFPVTDPNYDRSPYNGLTITVFKPGILLFRWEPEIPTVEPFNTRILDGQ